MRFFLFSLFAFCAVLLPAARAAVSDPKEAAARQTLAKALITVDVEEQAGMVRSLGGSATPEVSALLLKWKEGGFFAVENSAGEQVAVEFNDDADGEEKKTATKVADLEILKDAEGKPMRFATAELEAIETDSNVRRAIKDVVDLVAFNDEDPDRRFKAVQDTGLEQNPDKLPALEARQKEETSGKVKRALREAIAMIQLASEDSEVKQKACATLGEIGSIPSQDALKSVQKAAETAGDKPLAEAAQKALAEIASHVTMVNTAGTLFRGLSNGSVLLVIAIGLAITFGLMGVINMAHGELIAVGAYTAYVVQKIFGEGLALSPFGFNVNIPGMHMSGRGYDFWFVVAIPLSFMMAALVGLALERSVIRFLYKRPLESLLATWGVSLILQQLFKLVFGSNNVQVDSPAWLSGNWILNDVQFGWNRVFVIGFAVLIIFVTWFTLNKTPLGLLIRSVMQNREMAACMGVRTERVNMMTFAFGSGLAGLAGAFLTQIGNVGPGMGQNHITDAFMTVVVGGVGSLIGTVASAFGIGMVDQSLQQILGNPVLGKILVLGAIILFLQWRPSGLFVTRSRSLES
ncbi:MAG TPA: urea ABC transporter permease subunit UrtB [Verrucomicrobiales bacterium]|nr:urea ABC transporter permease subunit UrtB [Verrucomicrobiales bacterium]